MSSMHQLQPRCALLPGRLATVKSPSPFSAMHQSRSIPWPSNSTSAASFLRRRPFAKPFAPSWAHLSTSSIRSPPWETPTVIPKCRHLQCAASTTVAVSRRSVSSPLARTLDTRSNNAYPSASFSCQAPATHSYRKDPTHRPFGLHLPSASLLNMTSPFLVHHAPFNSAQTAPPSRLSPYSPCSNPDASLANPSPVSNTATCPPSPPWPSPSLPSHFTLW
ncbi:hypothetical protein LXA43DRAFT_454886 [Ganoderma leucocontextum]|nr:hypothetical protein LXA43DRAFT_454886 [Ganoderma leucocontextum]